MANERIRSTSSEREMELARSIRDSGVINFDQLGKLVTRVTPDLFDPSVAADDYIASAVTSVIKIWKMSFGPQLENIEALRAMKTELKG